MHCPKDSKNSILGSHEFCLCLGLVALSEVNFNLNQHVKKHKTKKKKKFSRCCLLLKKKRKNCKKGSQALEKWNILKLLGVLSHE